MHSILRGGQQNSKKLCARFSSVAKKKPLLEVIATSQRGSDSASSAAGSQLQVAQNPDLFAVKDPVYPLPGRSATDLSFYRGKSPPAVPAAASDSGRTEPERSMHEHQFLTLKNLEYYREVRTMASFPSLSPNDRLDFAVHNCPQALKNDFASLFPGVDVKKKRTDCDYVGEKNGNRSGCLGYRGGSGTRIAYCRVHPHRGIDLRIAKSGRLLGGFHRSVVRPPVFGSIHQFDVF